MVLHGIHAIDMMRKTESMLEMCRAKAELLLNVICMYVMLSILPSQSQPFQHFNLNSTTTVGLTTNNPPNSLSISTLKLRRRWKKCK